MQGYDQKSNVVLSDAVERTFSRDEGVKEERLGLYIAKGDTMCVVRQFLMFSLTSASVLLGEVDPQVEATIQLDDIRADPLPGVHW